SVRGSSAAGLRNPVVSRIRRRAGRMAPADPVSRPPPAARRPWAHQIRDGITVLAVTAGLTVALLEIGLRVFAPQITDTGIVRGPEVRPDPFTDLFVGDPATTYRNAPGARIPFQQFD